MTLTMKAVVIEAPHTVKVKDVPVPTLVEDSDVLIKVKLSGLCGAVGELWVLLPRLNYKYNRLRPASIPRSRPSSVQLCTRTRSAWEDC